MYEAGWGGRQTCASPDGDSSPLPLEPSVQLLPSESQHIAFVFVWSSLLSGSVVMCDLIGLSVCPWICLWISVCVFVIAAASALPIQSLSPWAEVNHLSAIKVKERTAVTDTSQDTSVSAVSLQTHTHSLYAHSLASPSFSLFSHCSKTVVRFPSFFRWRCLPPTQATLMFQDNLVH